MEHPFGSASFPTRQNTDFMPLISPQLDQTISDQTGATGYNDCFHNYITIEPNQGSPQI
jgi:hypothetical protein